MNRRRSRIIPFVVVILIIGLAGLSSSCKKHDGGAGASGRTYRMGFMNSAPRIDFNEFMHSLTIWPDHSDATIVSNELPWDSLLNGEDPVSYVMNNYFNLVSVCRAKNLKIWLYFDPANGLDRHSDAVMLTARGKSIAQTDVQNIYRRFVVVADSILHPDHLGLALETNLIRFAAPDSIYQGVKKAVNAAAADIRAFDGIVPLSVSVQAEAAWGKIGGSSSYVGIGTDFADFPFLQELGISSYPYMSFSSPADIPLDYYSRLVEGHALPVFVSEGGWTSVNLDDFGIKSSMAQQQAYIRRQGQLLDQAKAIGLFQLTFTDLALSGWPASVRQGLYPFAFLGMVDSNFVAKPAFAVWDSLRMRTLVQ